MECFNEKCLICKELPKSSCMKIDRIYCDQGIGFCVLCDSYDFMCGYYKKLPGGESTKSNAAQKNRHFRYAKNLKALTKKTTTIITDNTSILNEISAIVADYSAEFLSWD